MSKIFNDPIHGTIVLDPLLVKIIDTPQFQRLRNIKQLGGCCFVYPSASHTRFEHSIGTCHLASKLANQLQSKLKEDEKMKEDDSEYFEKLEKAKMSDKDKLCIEIAALCHDLGHGPYSHLFDRMFPEAMKKKDDKFKSWEHEQVSKAMFDYMFQCNESLENEFKDKFKPGNTLDNFEKSLKVDDVVTARKEFIKDLINGEGCTDNSRRYMYEIVANKLNAIDVDKMEYFARDCHGLGIRNTFDHLRFINQCRVMFPIDSENTTTIAVRDKEKLNLYELFHTRNGLFRRAYQHPVTHGIQLMIADALVEANEYLLFSTKHEEKIIKMSDAWKDMSVYEKLTDSVVDLILMHKDENGMKKAKDLIHRIYKRQLYRLVGQTDPEANVTKQKLIDIENDLQDEELFTKDDSKVQNDTEQKRIHITKDDFQVQKLTFSYGMKKKNPITSVYFYKKSSFECFPGEEPTKTSLFLPSGNFQEEIVLVYSTSLNKNKTDTLSRKWDDLKKNEDAKKAMK